MQAEIQNPSKYLGNELKYLSMVLNGESWSGTSGRWNNNLEHEMAKKIGCKYGVAFNSGTSTLHAALEAVGVKSGDEVITPALTVMMDTTAILHANAIPVYCDVDKDTFLIDPNLLEDLITPKTKAIIAVALYGLSPEYDKILEVAKKHNIAVIEDNAQAVLSSYKGKILGTIGDLASFSFENTKHISCGEGGMILTDSESYAKTVRKIGGHGFKNLEADEGRVRLNSDMFQDPNYKRHDSVGWNYRLSEFNAAVALAQLERVDELVNLRIETAKIFSSVMAECDYLTTQYVPSYCVNSYYALGVLYSGQEKIGVSWKDFYNRYVTMGGDGFYGAWSVPYLEPVMENEVYKNRLPEIYSNVKYEKGLCPVAERIQPNIMQFKTNYRDIELAKKKADVLHRVIEYYK